MRNANRDYFITLNAKNSTVTAGNLSFYITDKNTSNIFCQLIFNESNNQLINSYAPNENAEDYIITLRIVKPNNEPKEIRFSILSAPNFVYYVDLTDDYKDIIGTYECECFIDSTINGRLERNTTNSFTYTVKESIMSELDGLLEDLPSFPLIDNLATRDYVDKAITNGVDLTSFVTRTELHDQLDAYEFLPTIGDGTDWHIFTVDDAPELYDEKTYLLNKVRIESAASNKDFYNEIVRIYSGPYTITGIDTSISSKMLLMVTSNSSIICIPRADGKFDITENNFVIEQRMNEALANKADNDHTHSDYITETKLIAKNYATKEYVDTAISNIDLGSGDGTSTDMSLYAPKKSPIFTGSISLGRKSDTIKANGSFAVGEDVTADGSCSHAEGYNTIASGQDSHAEGNFTKAIGAHSHAEGYMFTTSNGFASHAEGQATKANGRCSHSEGCDTIANGEYQHVQGKFNIADKENKYVHIVGNGTSDTKRSNAHTIDWKGNAEFAGTVTAKGEMYILDADNRPRKVIREENNIRIYNSGIDIWLDAGYFGISFDQNGYLVIQINDVKKRFTPKEDQ